MQLTLNMATTGGVRSITTGSACATEDNPAAFVATTVT